MLLTAHEGGNPEGLPRYEKSALNLSEEQHRTRLGEAVLNELRWIVKDFSPSRLHLVN